MWNNKSDNNPNDSMKPMKHWLLWIYTILLCSVLVGLVQFNKVTDNENQKRNTLAQPKIRLGLPFAFGATNSSCDTIVKDAVSQEPLDGIYADTRLNQFHRQLFRFNKMESADIEMVFCYLVNRLGMDPDLTNLPQDISKVYNGHTINLAVTTASESWATSLGYAAKLVGRFDSRVILTLWWSGNGETTKGYLIQGENPLQNDGLQHLKYLQWDRTSTEQSINLYSTTFKSSYLSEPNYINPVDSTKVGGDRVHYARASYNSDSKLSSGQSIEIRQDRNDSSLFSCIKTQFSGQVGAGISIFWPMTGAPASVTDTYVDGTQMDGVLNITDDVSTPQGSGSVDGAPVTLPAAFDYSCNSVRTSGVSGAFQSNHVDYAAAPTSIFPN
jgi:hypothetical protein